MLGLGIVKQPLFVREQLLKDVIILTPIPPISSDCCTTSAGGHIIDGYRFMTSHGYDDCARICLTHSFPYKDIHSYNGQNDCTTDETKFIESFIENTEYNDYDKLIQLCDALALPDGATYIEKRLVDVVIRRGFNDLTIPKWKAFLDLKEYFDKKTETDIYKFVVYK